LDVFLPTKRRARAARVDRRQIALRPKRAEKPAIDAGQCDKRAACDGPA